MYIVLLCTREQPQELFPGSLPDVLFMIDRVLCVLVIMFTFSMHVQLLVFVCISTSMSRAESPLQCNNLISVVML